MVESAAYYREGISNVYSGFRNHPKRNSLQNDHKKINNHKITNWMRNDLQVVLIGLLISLT
ncbi:TPA: hypothetical protein ACK1JB_003171, partial [Morganella morganii]